MLEILDERADCTYRNRKGKVNTGDEGDNGHASGE
jgi:hypothetical protein